MGFTLRFCVTIFMTVLPRRLSSLWPQFGAFRFRICCGHWFLFNLADIYCFLLFKYEWFIYFGWSLLFLGFSVACIFLFVLVYEVLPRLLLWLICDLFFVLEITGSRVARGRCPYPVMGRVRKLSFLHFLPFSLPFSFGPPAKHKVLSTTRYFKQKDTKLFENCTKYTP
ncbi:hypothetical protein Hanom_Chr16g01436751 [Helianthus anomalus]